MDFMCTRKLNQDHVENLHCMIQGKNGYNDHPTPHEYITALRCLSCKASTTELVQSSHPEEANCEKEIWETNEISDLKDIEPESDIENIDHSQAADTSTVAPFLSLDIPDTV